MCERATPALLRDLLRMMDSNQRSLGYEPSEIDHFSNPRFVARRGFEPLSFSRITDRPKPLDERAIFILSYKDKKNFLIHQIFFNFFFKELLDFYI